MSTSSTVTVTILPNDSLRVVYMVKDELRRPVSLAGFTASMFVKHKSSDPSPIVTVAGTIVDPFTSAQVILPTNSLPAYGPYYAVVSVTNGVETYSKSFAIQVAP